MDLLLIDGHNDLPWAHREAFGLDLDRGDVSAHLYGLQTDLRRLATGGVKGQFWSTYVPSTLSGTEAVTTTLEQIDFVKRMVNRFDSLELALSADQVEAAVSRGRIASLIGVEGGHSIGNSLAVLRQFRELGVRYMTLTHNENTDWADSATDTPVVGGLSPFGTDVVREMNHLGIIVDLAHVADTTMHAALDTSRAPVIFSHSNARALCDTPRNVPDDVLARVPSNGGMVMATFVPFFSSEQVARWAEDAVLTASHRSESRIDPFEAMREYARRRPPPTSTIHDVVAHLNYLRDVVGIEHLGVGGDFDGNDTVTAGLEDVSCYPALFHELETAGWSRADLTLLAGRNVLRVLRDTEDVAEL